MALRMSEYESKLAWFLALLVVFLAVVSFQSVELSKRTRLALEAEFETRARTTSSFVEEKLRAFDLTAELSRARGASYVAAPRVFQDLEVRYGLASLSLLDERGHALLGSEPRERSHGPELHGLRGESARLRLIGGESLMGESYREPYGSRVLRNVYRPFPPSDGRGPTCILSVSFEVHPLASVGRLSSILLAYQVAGFLVLGVLLWVFVRWFLRPYRALMSTARAAGISARGDVPPDETAFVVATFKETIARLKDREEELRRLHLREKSRADEQARLASHITRSMASGVVVFTGDGLLDFMNKAAEEILRVEARELGAAAPEQVFRHAPELGTLTRASLSTGETHPRREVELSASGSTRSLGASTFPILDDTGTVTGALVLLTDLTDIKSLQERVRLRENLAALGEMSAGIAHEFRNSLAAIMGFTNLIEKKVGDRADLLLDVSAIKSEADGLNRVVSDFLRFARPVKTMLQPLDLKRLVSDLTRDLKSQPELDSVVFDHQELLPVQLLGDEVLLRQALGNLLRNGAEAALSGGGGTPRVEIRGFRDQQAERVLITITDSGEGIPEEARDRVFLPFYTTKERGTGLGLSITQKIVLAHDGEIRVEGRPGEGACFVISLPAPAFERAM